MAGSQPQFRVPVLLERLQFTGPRRSFFPVLAAIVVAVVFQLSVTDNDVTRLIEIGLHSLVIMLALRAAGARRHVRRVALGLLVIFTVAAAIALFGAGEFGSSASRIISLILLLLTPLALVAGVVRELREDGHVTVQTVACGLCLYLLLGLAFASLFAAIEQIGNEPFFNAGIAGTPNDFLYFSLATLTTTGYGDFSAATSLGRAMSVTEALIGQIYLVTVLAVIVSNVRQAHRPSRRA